MRRNVTLSALVVLAVVGVALGLALARREGTDARGAREPDAGARATTAAAPEALERGAAIFRAKCKECHALNGEGAHKAPALTGYLTRAWIRGVIANPDAPEYFGKTKIRGMDAFDDLPPETLDALADFLFALRDHDGVHPEELPEALHKGREVYEEQGCDSCHGLVPGEETAAPNLAGYGSTRWLGDFVRDPSTNLFFADDNEMTRFAGRLSDEDIAAVVAFLQQQSEASAAAR